MMIRIRNLQLFSIFISILLGITLGILLLLPNHFNNVYNYLISISSFILSGYQLIIMLQKSNHWITLIGLGLISLFNIISGILYILLHSRNNYKNKELHIVGTVLFIINVVFITSCFILSCIPQLSMIEQVDQESQVIDLSKKASDATLCNDGKIIKAKGEYSIENNWINNQDHGHIIPPSLSINSNLNQFQQNQQQQQQKQLLHSNSTNSELDKSRNISIMNFDEEVTSQHQHQHQHQHNPHQTNDINEQSTNTCSNNNCINKYQIKKQRWQSIYDEKIVLANINESLLPGVLKQQQSYNFDECRKKPISTGDIIEEDYGNTLNGLEEIPKSTHEIDQFNINDLCKLREVSGYNILPGSSNMVNDENLYQSEQYQAINDELLPYKETTVENIDNVSEFIVNKRPSLLHRSLSAPSIYDSQNGDAPSLYTFRKISDNSKSTPASPKEGDNEFPVTPIASSLIQPTTPPSRRRSFIKSQSAKTSPIKKFFQESPRRIFKSRSSYYNTSLGISGIGDTNHYHHHSNSVVSNNNYSISMKSSFSSSTRSSPIKKPLISKSSTMLKLHKYSISVPNFNINTMTTTHYPSSSINSDKFVFHSTNPLRIEPIDLWDIQTTNFDIDSTHPQIDLDDIDNDNDDSNLTNESGKDKETGGATSRISSLPSQVFGEYDKEKWTTLKSLQQKDEPTVCSNNSTQVEVI